LLALAAIELFVHLEPNLQPDQLQKSGWKDRLGPLRAIGDEWIQVKSSLAIFGFLGGAAHGVECSGESAASCGGRDQGGKAPALSL
jgi:hypothetical protein